MRQGAKDAYLWLVKLKDTRFADKRPHRIEQRRGFAPE